MGRTTTDTKQKLIDTALELILKSSYGSVSVHDICKAADVKKGRFYDFFPSKVDLAIAAMEESYKSLKPLYENFHLNPLPLSVSSVFKLTSQILNNASA
jgi:TetR/AcrR family transcriptional repressor of nem operon